ncbi:uncharacterized protein EAF02_008295 [Botrytis sinoallii]|uniref:uncharacterized protein n=1 Tax=Botrytis sinoallii TaxID=1463999 RepID=UPI0018FF714B|nr:uncharacterized protein EAF02_008295 [Botrytis sinoallii]KAF7877075.1 hypothetical protein EAF02_008295 [Botrytis sinoallii]
MEVLAGVSSVLSVLGFAIQLADGIKKACALWESLQEAPHEVQMICKDLRAISNVLDDIKLEENQFMHHSNSISEALGLCSEVLESLNHLSQKIVFPNTDTTLLIKRWRAMKGVIKIEKLQGLQSRLNSAKLTLVLARQNSSQLLSMQTYKSQQQLMSMLDGIKLDLQELASKTVEIISRDPPDSNVNFDALKVEARALACNIKNPVMRLGFERAIDLAYSTLSNPTERSLRRKSLSLHSGKHSISIINTPFGTNNIYITTLSFSDGTYKSCTKLIMHPSRLLQLCGVSLGVRVALSKSCGTFKSELKAYRAVPDDSTIFRLSASSGRLSTCKFLVDEGADLEVRDIQDNDLGSYVCGTWSFGYGNSRVPSGFSDSDNRVFVPGDICIEVLRMFLDQFEVSEDENSSGVIGLRRLASRTDLVANRRCLANRKLFYWTASMLQDQLILTSNLWDYFLYTLISAMELEDIDMIDHLFRSCPHDITEDWAAPAIGRCLVKKLRESDQTHLIRCMMSYGMDLHSSSAMLLATITHYPEAEHQGTITTLLLQSSAAFFRLKATLQHLGIDIAKFVYDEIQQGPVIAAGWSMQSLHAVFNLDYVPNESLLYFQCLHKCIFFPFKYGREFSWEILLDKSKVGSDFSSGVEDILREREEGVIKFQSVDGRVCSCCGKVGRSYATVEELIIEERRINWDEIYAEEYEAEEEDSMFLLSI